MHCTWIGILCISPEVRPICQGRFGKGQIFYSRELMQFAWGELWKKPVASSQTAIENWRKNVSAEFDNYLTVYSWIAEHVPKVLHESPP